MKKLAFLFAACLLGGSMQTWAQSVNQPWHGLRFSYDRTFMSADKLSPYGEYGLDMEGFHGFSFDYVHSFKIAKAPLFLETGIGLNYGKWSDDFDFEGGDFYDMDDWFDDDWFPGMGGNYYDTDVTLKIHHLGLRIPVNLVYAIDVSNKVTIKPYTGIYLDINLLGRGKISSSNPTIQNVLDKYDTTINLYDKDDMGGSKNTWNRAQVGWQIGATVDINKFNIGLSYGIDFNEIADDARTSQVSVKMGYNF